MASNHSGGLQRLINASYYSMQGLRAAYENEQAFRQEVWLLAVAVPLALWLGESGIERALLTGSVMLILIVELLNSAVEAVVDRVGLERNELAGRAKDLGSAAVLITTLNAAIIWGFMVF